MILNKIILISISALAVLLLNQCGVYKLNNGTTGLAKTATVITFLNEASTRNPVLAQNLSEKIRDKIQRQTRLKVIADTSLADFIYEGRIIAYNTSPAAIVADRASKTQLEVRIALKFRNKLEKEKNVEEEISAASLFDANKTLFQVENELLLEINENLANQIINKTLNNW